jgi:Zn-dependent protease
MNFADAAAWLAVFVFSVTFHEAAHAWVAKLGGDLTAYEGGQVSLDPLPHMRRSPFGMVVLPILTLFLMGWPLGFASAPYDPLWANRHPKRAAWMAFAGPASNFILVLVAVASIHIGIAAGIFETPDSIGLTNIVAPGAMSFSAALAFLVSIIFSMNLVLTIFNCIPFPPLDGSGIIGLLMSEDAARKYQTTLANPAFGFFGIFIAWKVFDPLFNIIFLFAINMVYPGHNYG